MRSVLLERLRQGNRTLPFPSGVRLPERFRGLPQLEGKPCSEGCRACLERCPTGALSLAPLRLDLGACTFCGACQEACSSGAIAFGRDHRLACRSRDALRLEPGAGQPPPLAALEPKLRKLLGRALRLRQVSAAGCNGCEAELVALGNVVFDAGRFGIQFVASPRHADAVVVTGPVSANMEAALRETLASVPTPRLVIAVGACAISGGCFAGSPACVGGVPRDLPIDLYVPGCPPHPVTILDGLLRLLGRL